MRARPRYHVSFGAEPGPLLQLDRAADESADAVEGWRFACMYRPSGNWIFAASYSFHSDRGHLDLADSIVHVPGHFVPGWFGGWDWQAPYDQIYLDLVTIDRDVHGYELSGGITFPGRWPRKRVFLSGTMLTGARCLDVRERHSYSFDVFTPTPSPIIRREASAHGWTWMLRARADLHITKFASLYAELISSQPLGDLRLGSSASWNGETRSVRATHAWNTDVLIGFGIALHL